MIKPKRGDTLIEVTIAIGIFSMIAITIASLMSSGTSGTQMALETTLAREEIDAQADALRFIHSSYISSRRFEGAQDGFADSPNVYRVIWGQILEHVNKVNLADTGEENGGEINGENSEEGGESTSDTPSILQFSPNSCDELYNTAPAPGDPETIFSQNAFILNLKQLSNPDQAVISSTTNGNKFATTETYPRVIFGNNSTNTDNQELSSNNTVSNTLKNVFKAAGIYIVAVQDNDSTNMGGTKTAGFYDFYIRSCWYGTDATRPSTISTVVRLYNPDVAK